MNALRYVAIVLNGLLLQLLMGMLAVTPKPSPTLVAFCIGTPILNVICLIGRVRVNRQPKAQPDRPELN
jgi:hypothetical protein